MKILAVVSRELSKYCKYEEKTLEFCLTLWCSTIIQSLCMIFISVLFFKIEFFLCFVLIFCPMRYMIEGYHCKTFKGCFFVSNIYFIIICLLAELSITFNTLKYIGIVGLIIAAIFLGISCIRKYGKNLVKNRNKIFFVIRLILIIAIPFLVLVNIILCKFKVNANIFIMMYSYIMVFVLTLI